MRKMLKKNKKGEDSNKSQTLIEHLDELRKRIIYSLLWLVAFTIIAYNFSSVVVRDMVNKAPDMNFVFIAPAELFMAYIKIALISALALSLPFILYNVWMFLSPGLEKKRKKSNLSISVFRGNIIYIRSFIWVYGHTSPVFKILWGIFHRRSSSYDLF